MTMTSAAGGIVHNRVVISVSAKELPMSALMRNLVNITAILFGLTAAAAATLMLASR